LLRELSDNDDYDRYNNNCFLTELVGSQFDRMMAPRFSISLIVLMLLITVFAATSKAEAPVCQIPEGHYDGEVVAYYHPEPRSGYDAYE